MAWYHRIVNVFRLSRVDAATDREMAFHLRERADELVARGLTPGAAMRQARRQFGNVTAQQERTREVDMAMWVASVLADLRYAVRALRASPGFATVAILSLALGIGANTAIFSLINTVMLKTLPVNHPEELVQLTAPAPGKAGTAFTNPFWEALRQRKGDFAGVFAVSTDGFDLATGGVADRVLGNYVSGDFFRTLGIRPALGRLLTPADDQRGCPAVAVLSEAFWRARYGASAAVVGKTLPLDGHPFVIVGVAQAGFSGMTVGTASRFFLPICSEPVLRGKFSRLDQQSTFWLSFFARPLPGTSLPQLRARLKLLGAPLFVQSVPTRWPVEQQRGYLAQVLSAEPAATGLSPVRQTYSKALLIMMGAVGLVLFIACANVANLLLARATVRRRELAIRVGLGAARGRLIRQLLTESLLLSLSGAVTGTLFAVWGSRMLVRMLTPSTRPLSLDVVVDGRVLGFTVLVAMLTGIFFGLVPAWRATRVDPQSMLKAGGRGVVEGHSRFGLGRMLVVVQVGLSLVLVITAVLLSQTLRTLTTLDAGFQVDSVLMVRADLKYARYPANRVVAVERDLLARLRAIPGVRSASTSSFSPLDGSSQNDYYRIEGYTPKAPDDALVYSNNVGTAYFQTLGTPLLAGRDFNDQDRPGTPLVAVVNATFARRFFGNRSPLGKRFNTSDTLAPPFEIVGVVSDTRDLSLRRAAVPMVYYPLTQDSTSSGDSEYEIRTSSPLSSIRPQVLSTIAGVGPDIMTTTWTLRQQFDDSVVQERLLASLSGFFGGLAALLAAIGLYGMMAYGVARRYHEIGVRMALGATRGAIVAMVLRELGTVTGAGVIIGTAGAFAATRLVGTFLYGRTPTDASSFAIGVLVLFAIAGAAGYFPARRAARQDPMTALREE